MSLPRCPRCGGKYTGDACFPCAIKNREPAYPPGYHSMAKSLAHESRPTTRPPKRTAIAPWKRLMLGVMSDGREWNAIELSAAIKGGRIVVCSTALSLVRSGLATRRRKDRPGRKNAWHYRLTQLGLAEARGEIKRTPPREKVLAATPADEWSSPERIGERAGMSERSARRWLSRLVAAGEVERSKVRPSGRRRVTKQNVVYKLVEGAKP